MIRALLYLQLTSIRNWLRTRVSRLRKPKYLIGAFVGGAYFWFFFFRHLFSNPDSQGDMSAFGRMGSEVLPVMIVAPLFVMALVRLVAAWIAPSNKPGLVFSEPEIAFLFPAPFTRRMLVNYKLLSGQMLILLSSLFFSLISSRSGFLAGGNFVTHSIGWWIMFSTLSLHSTGAAFTVKRLIDSGVSQARRQWIVTGFIVLFFAVAGFTLWRSAPPLTEADGASPTALFHYAVGLADIGLLRWATIPFKILLGPFLASGLREFLFALGPSLLLLGLHYIWVLRAETAFEEGTIALAEKRSKLIAALQSGTYRLGQGAAKARRAPFRLNPAGGRPETAFLWKNLLSTRSWLNPRAFVVAAAAVCVAAGVLSRAGDSARAALGFGGMLAMAAVFYILLLGPQFARQDFRSDLTNTDLLKTYPLPGWQIALGQLLAPVAILSGLTWLALLFAGLGLGTAEDLPEFLTPGFRLVAGLCVAAVAPLVCTIEILVLNTGTLMFPSWAPQPSLRERGFDVMGQRLVFVAGQMLMTAALVLPVALAGFLLFSAASLVVGPAVSTVVATGGILALLALEIGVGLYLLGNRFVRLDISSEKIR